MGDLLLWFAVVLGEEPVVPHPRFLVDGGANAAGRGVEHFHPVFVEADPSGEGGGRLLFCNVYCKNTLPFAD